MCIVFAADETFYITITNAAMSRLTATLLHSITQFLSFAKSNLSSNTTLYFLPGAHSLQSELAVGNINELHLQSFSADSLLKMATISCGSTARLLIENVYKVHVSYLHLPAAMKMRWN